MTWARALVLALWTVVFAFFGMIVFGFMMMGDCMLGPEGEACLAGKEAAPFQIWTGELIAYLFLTWAIFIRRWRKHN